MTKITRAQAIGLFALGVCLGAVFFRHFDVRIARWTYPLMTHTESVSKGLGGIVLISGEAALALVLSGIWAVQQRLSPLGKTLVLACLCSICAYAFNSLVLKVFCGVPTPAEVIGGARHAFALFHGTANSSFHSGHMALAGSFAGVLMRRYRQSVYGLTLLLGVAAVLLIVGDWHFVSDVIVGTVLGVSFGWLVGAKSRRL